MKPRATLLLLAALVALAAVAVLSRRPPGGDRGPGGGPLFPGLSAAEVRTVRVTPAGGDPVVLERGEGGWVVGPGGWPADAEAVERLLDDLAGLAGGTVVSTNPAKRAAYGLDEGRGTAVRLEGAGAKVLAAFRVGTGGPDFASSHLVADGAERVLLVPMDLRVPLGRGAAGWRDRRVLGFAAAEIAAVRIERDGGAVRLARTTAGDAWQVDGRPAEAGRVGEYLDLLATLRAVAFAEPADEPAAGFDEPLGVVTVEGAGRVVPLVVGAVRPGGGGQRYLRSGRFAEPLLVTAAVAESLLKTGGDFPPPPAPPAP